MGSLAHEQGADWQVLLAQAQALLQRHGQGHADWPRGEEGAFQGSGLVVEHPRPRPPSPSGFLACKDRGDRVLRQGEVLMMIMIIQGSSKCMGIGT